MRLGKMKTKVEILPGTIIHGTMRNEDLIPAFRRELSRIDALAEASIVPADDPDSEDGHEELIELFDVLDRYSPEGHYFGAHPGDGSDFGFWPFEE